MADLLSMPCITPIMKLDIDGTLAKMSREIEGGKESVECNLPFVAGCQEPIAEWKIPNMRGIMSARTKALKVVEPISVVDDVVYGSYSLPAPKGACKMIDAANPGELLTLLRNEAKVL